VPSIVPASVPEIVKASVTDPHALTFTLNKIDEQAQAERSRHGLARTNLTNSLEKFDTQTALLQLEAKNAIADMRSSYLTDKHGQKYPLYTEADIAAKQSEYDERIALLTQRQRLELQQAKDLESVSSNELDKSVEGLKSQFAKPANSQSVLLPSGTNLYVRNYLMNEQAAQPQGKDQDEMVASQDRMVLDAVRKHGAPVSHIVHESLSAQQDKLSETSGSRSGDAQMKVKGRLLPTPSGETR
jgi:hypothetical protein